MLLSAEEARVFGCLIEKSQATPEYYPMTLNALVAACNQKTSRDPVVEYNSEEVEVALAGLKEKGLCAFVSGGGRVMKYAHRGGENGLELSSAQLAALSILLLRGLQTVGEIKGRTERQFEFSSLEAVEQTLDSLMAGEKHFVEKVPRRAGQKEDRYRHVFFGDQDESEVKSGSFRNSLVAHGDGRDENTNRGVGSGNRKNQKRFVLNYNPLPFSHPRLPPQ